MIHWKKDGIAAGTTDELAYLKFYDEEGNEISINRGKTYIAVNYPNQTKLQ